MEISSFAQSGSKYTKRCEFKTDKGLREDVDQVGSAVPSNCNVSNCGLAGCLFGSCPDVEGKGFYFHLFIYLFSVGEFPKRRGKNESVFREIRKKYEVKWVECVQVAKGED